MKNLFKAGLNLTIIVIVFAIACDVEANANSKILNYLTSIVLLPFLVMAIYARTHLNEFKKFLND